ncbi:MAG: recombination protein RecR [Bacteroidales bacterium]|jgi:recombination protein RecR|nr:recombination protein RecR [Bacteroidales bacterium]MBQ6102021.1 recombination protein RecR [Bacteroidales bacterium]MBR0540289.1 recombination protein RecR [Bacteroidales bacterium]MBR3427221.1 recombination protein RecR [Bacteroidales bacterium]
MAEYSSLLLENAVESLSKLPGIGKKTALRLALHLLSEDRLETEQLADSLLKMKHNIMLCERCYNISDTKVCSICSNPRRDENTLCVVADMRDVLAIERTASYNGLYHVLGGVISPIEGISPNDLKIAQLIQRTKSEDIKEIILALPATIEGDTTNFYIFRQLNEFKGKISVISKGIAVGDALEFVDEITLGRSIQNRIPFNQK